MNFYCGKCEKPIENMNSSETPDGYLYSCPDCDSPVAHVSHEELEAFDSPVPQEGNEEEAGTAITDDEKGYLLHLINKQLAKLEHAICQLINIKTKLGGYDD